MGFVIGGELLQLDGDFGLRLLPTLDRKLAIREEAQRAGEAGERLVQAGLVEAAVGLEARGEAHAVAQAIDDARLTMLITRNDEVEAIGPEVDSGHQVAFADRGVVSVGHPSPLRARRNGVHCAMNFWTVISGCARRKPGMM